jgi:hypothetical protein
MPQEELKIFMAGCVWARLNTLQNVQGILAFRQEDVPVFIERAAEDTSTDEVPTCLGDRNIE